MKKTFYELVGIDKNDWAIKSKFLDDDVINFLENCYDGDFDGEFIGVDVSKFNDLVRLIRISNSAMGFFEHFPSHSEEEVLEAFSLLPSETANLFTRAYGSDLKYPICRANLSNVDRRKVDCSFSLVERRLSGLGKAGYACKNIFDLLSSYTEEEIWDAFYRLPFRYQEVLISAYGENLDDASFRAQMTKSEKSRVSKVTQSYLVPRLEDKDLGSDTEFSSLFDFFPHYPEERIFEVFDSLSSLDKNIIQSAFGTNLDDGSSFKEIPLSEKRRVYDIIRGIFYKTLEGDVVNTGRRPKNVFEYHSDYSADEIWDAVGRLPMQSQALLKRAYGDDLTDPSGRMFLSSQERKTIDKMLKGSLRRRLENVNLSSQKCMEKYHVKQFFEYFPLASREEIYRVISSLMADEQLFLVQVYGSDFSGTPSELDYEGKKMLSSIVKKISPALSPKKKRKNLYDFFPDFSHEEIYKAFLSLKSDHRALLIKAYGEDLSDSSLFGNLDAMEKKTVYRIISTSLRNRIDPSVKLGKKAIKNVFELLSSYSREDVIKSFESLNAADQSLLKMVYGETLDDVSNFYNCSASDRKRAYMIVFKKMTRIIRNGTKSAKATTPRKKRKSLPRKTTSAPRKKRSPSVKSSSRTKNDETVPLSSNIITATLSRDKYNPNSASKEIWYMKKLKLSYYYSDEIDEATRKLYVDYYCEVTPKFKKRYESASEAERVALIDNEVEVAKEFRDKFLRNNHRLIMRIIYFTNANSDVSNEELFQEGFIGMMRALEKYELTRGARFSTYSDHWIRQSINRYIHSKGQLIRTPVGFSEKLRKYIGFTTGFYQEFRRKPTLEEIASELGVSVERVKQMELYVSELSDPGSLDVNIFEDETKSIYEVLSDGDDFTFDVDNKDHLKFLKRIIEESNLDATQIMVLYLKFGIIDGICYSDAEISEKMGISSLTVRNIYTIAARKLRGNSRIIDVLNGRESVDHSSSDLCLKQVWFDIERLLDPRSFKIFNMVYVQEMDVAEVSEQLGIPYDEVFKISIDALKTVRGYMQSLDDKPKVLMWV